MGCWSSSGAQGPVGGGFGGLVRDLALCGCCTVELGCQVWTVALQAEGPLRRLGGGSVSVEEESEWGGGCFGGSWRFLKFPGQMRVQVFVVDCEGCRVSGGEVRVGL